MKISVITAVYNNRAFLEDAIRSVIAQTHQDIEHIVVDGGSTDGSVDIIRRHEGSIAKWASGPDRGIYDALNKGILMATGDVIGILHSDDVFASEHVLGLVSDTLSQSSADCCYGDLVYIGRDNADHVVRYWRSRPFHRSLMQQGWMPPHPTFFAKRQLYLQYGTFDTSFLISADYELMVRFLWKHTLTSSYIPHVITRMRLGGASNRSIRNLIRKSSEDYRVIRMHKLGGLGTLLLKNVSKIPQFFSGRDSR